MGVRGRQQFSGQTAGGPDPYTNMVGRYDLGFYSKLDKAQVPLTISVFLNLDAPSK